MITQPGIRSIKITERRTEIFQINLGDRCHQSCYHCHIGASPAGEKNMDYDTARKILNKLLSLEAGWVEFTGGTPELNPNLAMFIGELSGYHRKTAVRTNLMVHRSEPAKEKTRLRSEGFRYQAW